MVEADFATGLKGLRWTYRAGQGRQESKSRVGQWSTMVLDVYTGGHAIQHRKRRWGTRCIKRGVYQSQGGGSGGGVSTRRVIGKDPDYSWQRWDRVS